MTKGGMLRVEFFEMMLFSSSALSGPEMMSAKYVNQDMDLKASVTSPRHDYTVSRSRKILGDELI